MTPAVVNKIQLHGRGTKYQCASMNAAAGLWEPPGKRGPDEEEGPGASAGHPTRKGFGLLCEKLLNRAGKYRQVCYFYLNPLTPRDHTWIFFLVHKLKITAKQICMLNLTGDQHSWKLERSKLFKLDSSKRQSIIQSTGTQDN